jgi:uncharacterized membrane protein YgcG
MAGKVGIGLDIGEKRIGVARGDTEVRLASPLNPIIREKYADAAEVFAKIQGLKMFMTVAEAERIRTLQSVGGTEFFAKNGAENGEKIAKLYEKLLPYAAIFGIEKSWAKSLEIRYADGSSPDWYVGSGTFNAAIFANSLGSFSSSVNSFSGATGAGGGSVGGGGAGGGGGGGGW